MSRILIVRFSALGDVAMTIPVIASCAVQYPDHEITVLTRDAFLPLFINLPSNVSTLGVDLKNEYNGFWGIIKLSKKLHSLKFDYVIDLHSVLRTKIIRLYLSFWGIKFAAINKGRTEKRKLTQRKKKKLIILKSSFERYYAVFQKLDFCFEYKFTSVFQNNDQKKISFHTEALEEKGNNKWIGIAPFAKHKGKVFPLEKMEKIVEYLSKKEKLQILLFGGGTAEKELTEKWEKRFENTISLTGKFNLEQELQIISNLDVMLSMDSANMHLASLVNVPVVSIWGATHPYAGFLGWQQSESNIIQTDLACRPCSVYGQKPCFRGDYACMNNIDLKSITQLLEINLFKA
jgi:ADP-heptose:LPS heptosyltransferase